MANRFKDRPLSHSQLSSWEYDKCAWFDNYILGQRTPPNQEMLAGNRFGDMIGRENCPIGLHNSGIPEYELYGEVDGIKMVGFVDIYNPDTKVLHENKTSPNQTRWTQSKVDQHNQLTMYAMLLEQQDGTKPEDVTMFLNFIPLRLVGITYQLHDPIVWKQYPTARTKKHVQNYKDYIKRTVEEMDRYIEMRRLSPPVRSTPAFKMIR